MAYEFDCVCAKSYSHKKQENICIYGSKCHRVTTKVKEKTSITTTSEHTIKINSQDNVWLWFNIK